ncbi:MAG: DNA polymerase III subunit delta [Bacilli bacterium]|nr:DNA polymerase III subunit delta [Bacilli bacterium]
MNYLIYGLDSYLIKKEIDKIKKSKKISDLSISKYDLENTLIEEVIDDATTVSLFDEEKMIICDNAYMFTASTKKIIEQNVKVLENYIENTNNLCTIIFVVNYEKLDERKKIVKSFKKNCKIIECNSIDKIENYVKKMFDNYSINLSEINLLIDRVGNDLSILDQEIEKIKTYKNDDLQITKEDIINLTEKSIDNDIFHLIENIVNKNKDKALESLREMIKLKEEPIKIIIMLANQFRLIYQAKGLYKLGYTEADISKMLKVHPYRIKLSLSKGRGITDELLLKYIEKLADLDYKIKSGEISSSLALEMFILEN